MTCCGSETAADRRGLCHNSLLCCLAGSAFFDGSGTVFSWERLGAPPIQQDAGEFYEWLINALDGPKVCATASTV